MTTGQFDTADKFDNADNLTPRGWGGQFDTVYHMFGPNSRQEIKRLSFGALSGPDCGDIQFGFCLLALFGPYLDYVHYQRQQDGN